MIGSSRREAERVEIAVLKSKIDPWGVKLVIGRISCDKMPFAVFLPTAYPELAWSACDTRIVMTYVMSFS